MWLSPAPKPNIITIRIGQEGLTCYAFSLKSKKILLQHYAHFSGQETKTINGIVFNSSLLKSYITKFITDHDLVYSYSALAVDQPIITQALYTTNSTGHQQVSKPLMNRPIVSLLSDSCYYLSTIPEQYLFHYKLLSAQIKLHCLQITTPILACLALYDFFYPKNTIAYDNHTISSLYNHCMDTITMNELEHCVTVASDINVNKRELALGVGLFLLGKSVYEQS